METVREGSEKFVYWHIYTLIDVTSHNRGHLHLMWQKDNTCFFWCKYWLCKCYSCRIWLLKKKLLKCCDVLMSYIWTVCFSLPCQTSGGAVGHVQWFGHSPCHRLRGHCLWRLWPPYHQTTHPPDRDQTGKHTHTHMIQTERTIYLQIFRLYLY